MKKQIHTNRSVSGLVSLVFLIAAFTPTLPCLCDAYTPTDQTSENTMVIPSHSCDMDHQSNSECRTRCADTASSDSDKTTSTNCTMEPLDLKKTFVRDHISSRQNVRGFLLLSCSGSTSPRFRTLDLHFTSVSNRVESPFDPQPRSTHLLNAAFLL